jgi:hypothetical protein
MGVVAALTGMVRLGKPSSVLSMTYQDLITIVLFLAVALFFSDGGPGTPKRIRIPIPSRNWAG